MLVSCRIRPGILEGSPVCRDSAFVLSLTKSASMLLNRCLREFDGSEMSLLPAGAGDIPRDSKRGRPGEKVNDPLYIVAGSVSKRRSALEMTAARL
eukprot:scaffold757_cov246-Pinguiococcus_pyrenoidosus.AAC.13